MTSKWKPDSWQNKSASQIPTYVDKKKINIVKNKILSYPPLILAHEIKSLKKQLKKVCNRKAFIIHGGDCAESFSELTLNTIQNNFTLLLQMSLILGLVHKKPIVQIGRIAGQFAKPRSSEFEILNNKSLYSYRGDIINKYKFDKNSRKPDPLRMEKAYFHSAATLNLLRALSEKSTFPKKQLSIFDQNFLKFNLEHELIIKKIHYIFEYLNVNKNKFCKLGKFYISHEALLLPYEEAMLKLDDSNVEDYYDSSAHLLWIGERTRDINGAHVEFMRGISNPIAIKCSSKILPEELVKLIDVLNPKNEIGRLIVITRFGYNKIEEFLPNLIRKIEQIEGRNVIWCCDPMHGNTFTASNGYKTRNFIQVLSEAKRFFEIHKNEGSYAGGIHLEMTGKHVTECIGGKMNVSEKNLKTDCYKTLCDPRFNSYQALEFVLQLINQSSY